MAISSKDFLIKLGTRASLGGLPTGINRNGFSFSGLFNTLDKKFIGLGVCVKATNPA
jgi:hypothetical protein